MLTTLINFPLCHILRLKWTLKRFGIIWQFFFSIIWSDLTSCFITHEEAFCKRIKKARTALRGKLGKYLNPAFAFLLIARGERKIIRKKVSWTKLHGWWKIEKLILLSHHEIFFHEEQWNYQRSKKFSQWDSVESILMS